MHGIPKQASKFQGNVQFPIGFAVDVMGIPRVSNGICKGIHRHTYIVRFQMDSARNVDWISGGS